MFKKTPLKTSLLILFIFVLFFSIKGSAQVCDLDARDPDGNSFNFELTRTTSGVIIEPNTGEVLVSSEASVGNYVIEARAEDEFGAVSDPAAFNMTINSFCGDQVVSEPNSEGRGGPADDGYEECDGPNGIAYSPEESGPNKMYGCTGNCAESATDCSGTCAFRDHTNGGGYCGDGFVQTSFGESCDPSETASRYASRTGDGSVLLDDNKWRVISESCDPVTCSINCADASSIGRGCYIDDNKDGVINGGECQKGLYYCDPDEDVLSCYDIFTEEEGQPLYDYCCLNEDDELKDGIVNGKTITRIDLPQQPNLYKCDDVCRTYDPNNVMVCVGVGMTNPATTACQSVRHDERNSAGDIVCNTDINAMHNDCLATYSHRARGGCDDDSGVKFKVGEAACYCY